MLNTYGVTWTLSYPNTFVYPLVMETSDHVPCVISISTSIPKRSHFQFENYWMEHPDFLSVVQQGWLAPHYITDSAKVITTKFKNLRRELKLWQKKYFQPQRDYC